MMADDQESRRHRRRRHGRGHRRPCRQCRRAGRAARHRAARTRTNRNAIAEGAVEKMLKTDPAPFMSKAAAKLVTTGNIEDDLDLLADCDWIVEAVVERLDVKQALYAKIEAVRKPGSVVSSNTSTIPLANLIEGMPDALRAGFPASPISSIRRATCGCWRSSPGRRRDPTLSPPCRDFADCRARQERRALQGHARASSPTASASTGCRSAVIEAIDLGLDVEEADAHHRQADGHSEDRRLRPARSGRPRPDAACQCQPGAPRCRRTTRSTRINRDAAADRAR